MSEIFSSPIINDALAFALSVFLCAIAGCLLVLAAEWLARLRSLSVRHCILMGGILVLLCVPVLVCIGLYLPATPIWPGLPPQEEIVRLPVDRLPELMTSPAADAPVVEADWNPGPTIALALVSLWGSGCLIVLGRLLLSIWRQRRAVICRPWQAEFWTEELQARLARHLGLPRFPAVFASPIAPMPMVVGTWRPVILLPEQAPPNWGKPQWEAILLHEGAHIARRDPWAVLAQRLAVAMYWWCPLVHVLSRRLSALRESICDEYALIGSCDPISYAEILVESAERLLSLKAAPVPLALLDSAQRGLETRVTRLLTKERKPMTQLSRIAKLFGAVALGTICLATVTATALAQAQPEKKVQIKIIVDGKELDLSDPRVWDHIQAAPRKASDKVINVIELVDRDIIKPATPVRVHLDLDKATDPANPKKAVNWRTFVQDDVVRATQATDPRVEELVKQAEAIKPGSGAAIRKALQGTPKKADTVEKAAVRALTFTPEGKQIVVSGQDTAIKLNWSTATGKALTAVGQTPGGKKIILIIEDGKVTQLQESEAKALGIRMDGGKTTTKLPVSGETKKEAGMTGGGVIRSTKTAEYKPATQQLVIPPPPDLDALRRQIDRISAELKALKSRLDAPAK